MVIFYIVHVGSEYRSWVLYYALPVMKGVLSPAYFNHLCLLVSALHILTSDYIRTEKLAEAEQALRQFYLKFSELYGKDNYMDIYACMCMYNNDIVYSINQSFIGKLLNIGIIGKRQLVCMCMHACIYIWTCTCTMQIYFLMITCRRSANNNELPYVEPFVYVCKKLGALVGI